MNKRFLLSAATMWLVMWSAPVPAEPLKVAELKQFNLLSEVINRATEFTLYEGLPHQRLERRQLQIELDTMKTVRLQGYPFYEQTLEVSDEVVKLLRQLCISASSFETNKGPKRCGGFHPDYCLVWKDGDTTCRLLICFGCREMKLHSPDLELLVDVQPDAYKKFGDLLKPLRNQRPPPQ
jgi:hypothetical protein